MNALTERVEFDMIRYANCWEDADLLVDALRIGGEDRVLSIASAGDNSFALLASGPQLLVAVDVSEVQLFLCELKKAAFSLPDHESFLAFLGFSGGMDRIETYKSIRHLLSARARHYWDHHTGIIAKGVISQGKLELYFTYFRKYFLPYIHKNRQTEKLFTEKSSAEQLFFYEKTWNTWRWKLFFKIFFSRYVLGKYGRDPEFMKEVRVKVSEHIYKKAEKHLKSNLAQSNFYLRRILTGEFAPRLPFYARKENFHAIRENLTRIVFVHGYAEDAIKKHKRFTAFNLSNIFEYLSETQARAVSEDLVSGAEKGARFAYWNLMVPRNLSSLLPGQLEKEDALSRELSERDLGFFYLGFNLDSKK
ncbi:MAG TPA: DUF3419 family protein [Bacteroidia bacterium]|nr:DUF3419 family protein [Bacteroidia bacterium]